MRFRPLLIGLLVIVIGLAMAKFIYVGFLSTPTAGEPISVTVSSQATFGDVASELAKERLISSAWMYRLFSAIHPSARVLHAGTYSFRIGASLKTIADTIARGPTREIVSIRITEGETIAQEAAALQAYGVDPAAFYSIVGTPPRIAGSSPAEQSGQSFDRSLETDYPFLKDVPAGQTLEGYLFPDTYEVWKDSLPKGLVEKQLSAFEAKVVTPLDADRKASGKSWYEVMTLASIVEGEVQTDADRKIVAGLFLHRLKSGMRLQSDAILNYVMPERNARPDAQDLAISSPYNTYDHDGLPPGPIGNPGFSAIDAAIHPSVTEYFYFLTDEEGNVLYAKTYDEHLKNKVKAFGK
jgi:UPF0755 protein